MQHVHDREHLSSGAVVQVDCDHQCNVLVMDDANYARYRRGDDFRHLGGFYEYLPAIIPVSTAGFWNVVIDLGGGRARIEYEINYLE